MNFLDNLLPGISLATGAGQFLTGLFTGIGNNRPTYNIPGEVRRNVSMAENLSKVGLPDAQVEKFQQGIDRNTSSMMRASEERGGGLGMLSAIGKIANDANMDLLSADTKARMDNITKYMAENARLAEYKDKQFEINEMEPFRQRAAASGAMMGAGMQNINDFAKQMEYRRLTEQLYGIGGDKTPSAAGSNSFDPAGYTQSSSNAPGGSSIFGKLPEQSYPEFTPGFKPGWLNFK